MPRFKGEPLVIKVIARVPVASSVTKQKFPHKNPISNIKLPPKVCRDRVIPQMNLNYLLVQTVN